MKKLLFILTITISSLFIANSVSAETIDLYQNFSWVHSNNTDAKYYAGSGNKQNATIGLNNIADYYRNHLNRYYFYITLKNYNTSYGQEVEIIFVEKKINKNINVLAIPNSQVPNVGNNTAFSYNFKLLSNVSNVKVLKRHLYLRNISNSYNNLSLLSYNDYSNLHIFDITDDYLDNNSITEYSNDFIIYDTGYLWSGLISLTSPNYSLKTGTIYDTNLDFYLVNNQINNNIYNINYNGILNDIVITNGDKLPTMRCLNSGDTCVSNFGDYILNANYSGDKIYSYNISIPINNYSNDYIYQFKTPSTEWLDMSSYITNNTFNDLLAENGTYFYRILDSNNNNIDSFTISLSRIDRDIPFLDINSSVPDYCLFNNQTICKLLSVKPYNLFLNNAVAEYSTDTINWVRFDNDLDINVSENITYYFRIITLFDSQELYYETFTFSGIELPVLEQNVSINIYSELIDDNSTANLYVGYYGLDLYNTNVWYKYNNGEWLLLDINLFETINADLGIYNSKLKVYENGTYYFKITDLEGNYITSATYTLTQISRSNNESIFSFIGGVFEYFGNGINTIFKTITSFFDLLPIGMRYLFGGIFILFIVLFLIKFIL